MSGVGKHGKWFRTQIWVPEDVREHFDGKQKVTHTFRVTDQREADRLGAEAEREFKAKVLQIRQAALNGERIDPIRIQQITGYLFGQFFNRQQDDRYFDLAQSLSGLIAEAHEEGFPLLQNVPAQGAVFDELVRSVETLLEYAEGSGYAKGKKPVRAGATMNGAAAVWAPKARHTPKTKDQYVKDVTSFSDWFEVSRGQCYGAKVNRRDVNDYVSYLMSKDAAKATILRSLSALKLIYKSGQFGTDNPFSGVSDRMVIEGKRLDVRKFTDGEIIRLLKLKADANAHMTILIAAYSGMRISEIAAIKIEHIERIGSHRVFNLMNAGRRKTKASYRKVPIHSRVWKELQPFIKGRKPDEYMLDECVGNKYGERSSALSKRVSTLIDVIDPDPALREHSLRHAAISKMAEKGIRKEWRMAIVGHEGDGDVHDQYTQVEFLTQLLTEVEKIEYVKPA